MSDFETNHIPPQNDDIEAIETVNQDKIQQQFNVAQTPYHTHNNIDSPSFSFTNLSDVPDSYTGTADALYGRPIVCNFGKSTAESAGGVRKPTGVQFAWYAGISYIGLVNSDGTSSTPFPIDGPGMSPRGGTGAWSSATTATGTYTVTHNIGTAIYVVNIQCISSTNRAAVITSRAANTFSLVTFTTSTGAAADTAFMFTLTI